MGRVQLTAGTDGRYAVRVVRGADTLAGTLAARDDSIVLHLTDPRPVTGAYVAYSPVSAARPDGGNARALAALVAWFLRAGMKG